MVQPDHERSTRGGVEAAVHCFAHVAVVHSVALRVDAETKRAGETIAVRLVFASVLGAFTACS